MESPPLYHTAFLGDESAVLEYTLVPYSFSKSLPREQFTENNWEGRRREMSMHSVAQK